MSLTALSHHALRLCDTGASRPSPQSTVPLLSSYVVDLESPPTSGIPVTSSTPQNDVTQRNDVCTSNVDAAAAAKREFLTQ